MKVIGIDMDGYLIIEDDTGEVYNCGQTLDEFGISNLTPDELTALGL
jgi:hypothetical protein